MDYATLVSILSHGSECWTLKPNQLKSPDRGYKKKDSPGWGIKPPCLRAVTLQQSHRAPSAAGSFFHSLGAKRAKSLERLDRRPVFFSSGSDSIPVFGDLSAQQGLL